MLYSKKRSVKCAVKFLIAVFIFTMFSGINKVMAADFTSYYNGANLRIGLESMMSNSINVTINGDYTVNSTLYKSGTSFTLLKSNDKIDLNGSAVDSVNFVPSQAGNTISITSGSNKYKYLGTISFQIKTVGANIGILPINSIYIEDYLKGVVPSEMYSSYNIEALKAQAIAARNYALRNLNKYGSNGYDLNDTISCQVYKGYYGTLTNVDRAVYETKGMVLQYQSNIIEALYSASNGGYIEDSSNVWGDSYAYYKEKLDTFDPEDSWTKLFTATDIDTILKSKKIISSTDTFTSINRNTITYYPSGRVSNIEINYVNSAGAQQMLAYSKDSARTFLSLPSSLYTISFDEKTNTYTFTGKGNGHGIGMSQKGAQQMALSGKTYSEILNFYYPGTNIVNLVGDITTPTTPTVPSTTPDGWVLKNNSWYLYKNNISLTGWQFVNNKWYYLDSTGIMKTGWFLDGTTWYFLDNSGAMAVGWTQVSGKWYFLKSSGAMATGWVSYGGKWYYLYSSGAMAFSTTIGSYKLDASGAWIK
ncbi:MAG: SpoIID/LytB protein [Clostridiaceae bacterium]|jgi:stage II sporulation protein D|nr:SpoIID/LytB protein [Clostridiaceae bacterium]